MVIFSFWLGGAGAGAAGCPSASSPCLYSAKVFEWPHCRPLGLLPLALPRCVCWARVSSLGFLFFPPLPLPRDTRGAAAPCPLPLPAPPLSHLCLASHVLVSMCALVPVATVGTGAGSRIGGQGVVCVVGGGWVFFFQGRPWQLWLSVPFAFLTPCMRPWGDRWRGVPPLALFTHALCCVLFVRAGCTIWLPPWAVVLRVCRHLLSSWGWVFSGVFGAPSPLLPAPLLLLSVPPPPVPHPHPSLYAISLKTSRRHCTCLS
jgi:hypothetical protein